MGTANIHRLRRSAAQVARCILVASFVLVAMPTAGCGLWTPNPPFSALPAATTTLAAVRPLPGAIHLSPSVVHLTPTVTRTAANGTFTDFQLPLSTAHDYTSLPVGLAVRQDGTVWFGEVVYGVIGSLTPSGTLTTYRLPHVHHVNEEALPIPGGAVWGQDGALWFTVVLDGARNFDAIDRLTLAGDLNEFQIPAPYFLPTAIVVGPDQALWFIVRGPSGGIGRISLSGQFTVYPIPKGHQWGIYGLTAGPDGALWFTTQFEVGRLSVSGAFAWFAIPPYGLYTQDAGAGITAGPDGALWFAASRTDKIGRITPEGSIAEYAIPTSGASPDAICSGRDGALWFTERYANKLGRITPGGRITEIPVPLSPYPDGVDLTDIKAGPDGAVWFIEQQGNVIGRLA